ncbi:hypothetical protein BSKO_05080 [Bryopsis sp. KO-2023]|nr:hypothetical protein BSKO_05080 [Bryopsis sp. KO-2023]
MHEHQCFTIRQSSATNQIAAHHTVARLSSAHRFAGTLLSAAMDRWGREEDDFDGPGGKGVVARVGLSGFVKQESEAGPEAMGIEVGKVEVVPSRKVQKEIQKETENERKRETTPPRISNADVPPWEGSTPTRAFVLRVMKDGVKLDDVEVEKELSVVGRHATADVILEHGSISRQHASFLFDRRSQSWLVEDLGSVHGTFLNKERLSKGNSVELVDGSELRFGASTRTYVASISAPRKRRAEEEIGGRRKKKRYRVRFADEVGQGELEQVIGYSDGDGFVVNVGPRPAEEGETGQFETSTAGTSNPSTEQRMPPPPRGLPFKLQQVVEDARAPPSQQPPGGCGLYDEIPPSKGDQDD